MRSVGALAAVAACGFHPSSSDTSIDGSMIAPVDSTPIATCTAGSCPVSCGDVSGLANDTTTMLYVGGDPSKPWSAFCHDGSAYLSVTGENYGQYTAGGQSNGSNVRTTYTRIAIDPVALTLDICDETFAASVGELMHGTSGIYVTSMPLGVAMDCANNYSDTGVAAVDLTGTPFAIAATWSEGGNKPDGSAMVVSPRAYQIMGGGYCGWNAPTDAPDNPFNQFGSANLIAVSYSPD
jgi:hypothetical protein